MWVNERGRTPDSETQQTRSMVYAVIRHYRRFTAPMVSEKTGKNVDEVRRALKFFEKSGMIVRTNEKKIPNGGGRPAIVWLNYELEQAALTIPD